jgi:peptidyl-tRNA hydrolase
VTGPGDGVSPASGDRVTAVRAQELLAPLVERQRHWLAGDLDDVPEDPDEVRAQPLVVRLEKAAPPGRTAALEAAATAALAVFFDPRAAAGGEWADALAAWVGGRIRKVSRRARGNQWAVLDDLPGVTVSVGDAEVRAFPPYRVVDPPKEISRLQVSGTDLTDSDPPGPVPPGVPVLWLTPHVEMTAGKSMAQVGHATMLLAAYLDTRVLQRWADAGLPVAVRTASPEQWVSLTASNGDARVATVRDAGFTEVEPGTVTVVADGSALG